MGRGLLSRPEARSGRRATLSPNWLAHGHLRCPFVVALPLRSHPKRNTPFLYAWRPLAGVSDGLVSCDRWTGRRRAGAARRAEVARQRMQPVRSASMCRTTRRASTRAPIRSATAASTSGAAGGMRGARLVVEPSPSYDHPPVFQSECSRRRVQCRHRPRRPPRCSSSERGRMRNSNGCGRSMLRASWMARSHARIPLLGVSECWGVREHAQRSSHRCSHHLFRQLPRHQSPLPRNLGRHPSGLPFLRLLQRSSLLAFSNPAFSNPARVYH